jgi:hypothetical protein
VFAHVAEQMVFCGIVGRQQVARPGVVSARSECAPDDAG